RAGTVRAYLGDEDGSVDRTIDDVIGSLRSRVDRLLRRVRLIAAVSQERGLWLDNPPAEPWSEGRGRTPPASLAADTPPIVTSTQPYQVTLSARALQRIREITSVARDGDEWGGWLFGVLRS